MKINKNGVVFDERNKYNYSQFIDIIQRKSDCLKQLPEKSKCGILCEHRINCAIAVLACWRANLIPIMMSYNYGKKHWEKIIALTEPIVVIQDNSDRNIYHYEFCMETEEYIGNQRLCVQNEMLDEIALIMCTSGTTGLPKGVLLRESGLKKNVLSILEYFKISRQDKILIARPLYHCAVLTGELLVALYIGCDIGFLDGKYQPIQVIDFCCKNNISVLGGTPTLFNHLSILIQRNHEVHSIKKIVISGECLGKIMAQNIRKSFVDAEIYNVYGMTEASPRISYLPPEKFDKYPESVGIPLDEIEIKIVNGKEEVPPFEKGEILVKTPCVMQGYYKNRKTTTEVITSGWLHTGDIGYKDANGYLYVLLRKDDMIIKGGMNIYPKEIENQVLELDEIKNCIVYRINMKYGQEIGIDIILEESCLGMKEKELRKLLVRNLASYQIPSRINIVTDLKYNISGKIIRNEEAK